MLRKLSKEVRRCHERAEDCKRKAEQSISAEQRDSYLQIAKNWENLARSYEFSGRLLDFTMEYSALRKTGEAAPTLH